MNEMFVQGMRALGAGLAAMACIGGGIGTGIATARAVEGIARQPEASGEILKVLIIGGALSEATAIYGLLIAFMLIFVGP